MLRLLNIVGKDILVEDISNYLSNNKGKNVDVEIVSPGGNLDDGLTSYRLIGNHDGYTSLDIIGSTASAGTVIACAFNWVSICENAGYLIHNSSDPEGGNAKKLERSVKELKKADEDMVAIYVRKTGQKADFIRELMAENEWLTAQEALKYGFVDEIKPAMKIAACVDYSTINKDLQTIKFKQIMGIFNTKKPNAKATTFELAGGKGIFAINAEELEDKAEVTALNGLEMPDGNYELKDGTKFSIKDGKVGDVIEEPEAETEASVDTDAVIEALTGVVKTAIAESEERTMKEITALKDGKTSKHTIKKKTATSLKVDVEMKDPQDAIDVLQKGFKEAIDKK